METDLLSSLMIKASTLFAERPSARPLAKIFPLDVVAGVALSVVVVNRLLDGMPWCFACHGISPILKTHIDRIFRFC